jgi:hypothetical protein
MINATELRLGNKVRQAHATITITAIGKTKVWATDYNHKSVCNLANINPIPLTAEILEKCGFVKEGFWFKLQLTNNFKMVFNKLEGCVIVCSVSPCDAHIDHITSLHQLQNLYFALTGEELIYTQ